MFVEQRLSKITGATGIFDHQGNCVRGKFKEFYKLLIP